jgi:hypothetical protein
MAGSLLLTYLIDGTSRLSTIAISCGSTVDILRKNIFEARWEAGRGDGLGYENISLLKVRIIPHSRSWADSSDVS